MLTMPLITTIGFFKLPLIAILNVLILNITYIKNTVLVTTEKIKMSETKVVRTLTCCHICTVQYVT